MKMFKRFAAALLAGVMVLAMLTACGGGSGSGTSTIGEEFENKYIAAINTLRGEKAENWKMIPICVTRLWLSWRKSRRMARLRLLMQTLLLERSVLMENL